MKNRSQILDHVPEESHDQVSSYIDELEDEINRIIRLMDIGGVDDLHKIEEAKSALDDLAKALF